MSTGKSAGRGPRSCHEKDASTGSPPSNALPLPGDHPVPNEDPLEKIEGRWTLQILLCLAIREHRFADLRTAIPRVSANILTDRLRALEYAGLVERAYLPPPHASHVYMLTKLATGLKPALAALARWRAAHRRTFRSQVPEMEQSR